MKLREFLETSCLETKLSSGVINKTTAAWLRSCVNGLESFAGRELLCEDVDQQLLDGFKLRLLKRGYAKNTVEAYLRRIHTLIRSYSPNQLAAIPTDNGRPKKRRVIWQREEIPKYKVHKNGGRQYGAVTINGRTHYLGRFNTPESLQLYHRLIAEYLASGKSPAFGLPVEAFTVETLVMIYLEFARSYYGEGRGEFPNMEAAVKPLMGLYSGMVVTDFGPQQLKAVRQAFIDAGNSRSYINARVKRIVRVFRWGVSEGLLPSTVADSLAMVPGLRRGRTTAHDTAPVLPVDPAVVDATLPHLHPILQAMVTLQRLTGARPGEVCIMRPCDVSRAGEIWEYRPSSHKNINRGLERVIKIGPKAQEVLRPYLLRAADSYCFSAAQVSADNQANSLATRPARTTPRYPCEVARIKRQAAARRRRRIKERLPAERYRTGSYSNAIRRACIRAFGADGARWSPNQLRHLAGTEVRRLYGLEGAQIILGHKDADVTQIYAERNSGLGNRIAKEVG
jgi:integrase